ncbi:XisH family protein [Microcoleus sp. herbarium19]|uniref:XisH family protein n=1 Tax=unclassified Microcoleus TaxID=2642155 RepID=UPI002FD0702A
MAAKDKFHDVVKAALEKDGWEITHDPLLLRIQGIADMYVDLGAEKLIAADRSGEKIAVEVKSFIGTSTISEFHTAIGQFINYRYALEVQEPARVLYLAVPLNTYNNFFVKTFVSSVVQRSQINLIVYDIEREEIAKWQI